MKKNSTNYAIKMLGLTVIAFMAMLKPTFCQEPEIDKDLIIYTKAVSPDQQVKFWFPLDMRSGGRITGTVVEEKRNKAGEVNKTSSSLQGMVIEIDGKQTKLTDRFISFLVPAGITSLPFLLKNAAGEIVERGELPVDILSGLDNTVPLNGANFKPSPVCEPGQQLSIAGNFDGRASNTRVSVGGQNCEVMAESNGMSIIRVSPTANAGVSSVTIQENNITEEHKINVAILSLSTDKATIGRGKQATISVSVSGLQGLENGNDCRVVITNLSPSVVSMKATDGNTFSKTIPQDITGEYKFNFNIVGVTQGNYALEGVLFCAPPPNLAVNGPEYTKWQERYKEALRKRLLEEGFTKDEISDIVWDSFKGIKGIIKNLWRLYKAKRAIDKARKDVGDPPDKSK